MAIPTLLLLLFIIPLIMARGLHVRPTSNSTRTSAPPVRQTQTVVHHPQDQDSKENPSIPLALAVTTATMALQLIGPNMADSLAKGVEISQRNPTAQQYVILYLFMMQMSFLWPITNAQTNIYSHLPNQTNANQWGDTYKGLSPLDLSPDSFSDNIFHTPQASDHGKFVEPVVENHAFFKRRGRVISNLNFIHLVLNYNITELEQRSNTLCTQLDVVQNPTNVTFTPLKKSIITLLTVRCNHLREDLLKLKMIWIAPSRQDLNKLDLYQYPLIHDLPLSEHLKRQQSIKEREEELKIIRFLQKEYCTPFLDVFEAKQYLVLAKHQKGNLTKHERDMVEIAKNCKHVFTNKRNGSVLTSFKKGDGSNIKVTARKSNSSDIEPYSLIRKPTIKPKYKLVPRSPPGTKRYLQERARRQTLIMQVRKARALPVVIAGVAVGVAITAFASALFSLFQLQQQQAQAETDRLTTVRLLQDHETRIAETEGRLETLVSWLRNFEQQTSAALADITQSFYASVVFDEVEKDMRAIIDGLYMLTTNRLSPNLVNLEQLRSVFNDMQIFAAQRGLQLAIKDVSGLFNVEVSYIVYDDGKLTILVHIPVMGGRGTLNIYQYLPAPILLSNSSFAIPKPEHDLIAVAMDEEVYRPMRVDTLQECRSIQDLYYCELESFVYKHGYGSCIEALYLSNEQQMRDLCEFRFLPAKDHVDYSRVRP